MLRTLRAASVAALMVLFGAPSVAQAGLDDTGIRLLFHANSPNGWLTGHLIPKGDLTRNGAPTLAYLIAGPFEDPWDLGLRLAVGPGLNAGIGADGEREGTLALSLRPGWRSYDSEWQVSSILDFAQNSTAYFWVQGAWLPHGNNVGYFAELETYGSLEDNEETGEGRLSEGYGGGVKFPISGDFAMDLLAHWRDNPDVGQNKFVFTPFVRVHVTVP